MKSKLQTRIVTATVALAFAALTLFAWLKPADAYSDAERRGLAQMPKLSMQTILAKNSFMQQFESYATDQFPLREPFRALNAGFSRYVLWQKLVNDIAIADAHAFNPEYPLNGSSVNWALSRMDSIYERSLQNSNIYFAIVPDKGYYLAEKNGYPVLDYDALISQMREHTASYSTYVDLTETLSADSYYRTDTHWKQELLLPAMQTLLTAMDAPLPAEPYETNLVRTDFDGVYLGQSALALTPDTLQVLTNPTLEQLQVTCLDSGEPVSMPLYDMDKAFGKDGYELFLGGSLALVKIENPSAPQERELVIFRDSFGSAIAPLLAQAYSSVTVIDTRYISPAFLDQFVSFDGADVLFLYSTLVLNNSEGQLLP